MGETEEFNTLAFEKKLMQLKDTQESIQGLSSWCLKQRDHHKKIVASWLNVLKRVKVEQRLVLFYLANDVIQYSKRKNYDFVESWGLNLQKATPLVRDEKVRHKILRIFKIWEQRSVYDDEFLSDLTGLLSAGAIKKTDDDPLDFQPQQLVNKIKQCTVLEADTDLRLKNIHESHLQLSDTDALCTSLKERSNKEDVEKELNEGIQCVERYTQALQREIVAREALLALLSTANQYYSTQRGEVKVVAYAYKNFGARVRALKRKLDELTPTLPPAAPSPPRRDEDVPSPGPDEDLDLPAAPPDDIAYNIDRTFNTSVSADGSLYNLGLTSFLSSDNPISLFNDSDSLNSSANKIEVINSRPNDKQDFDINNFLKTLVPNDSNLANSDNNSVSSASMSQKSGDALPGLDLLTPDSTGIPPPPTSFYGTSSLDNADDPEPYHPEMTTQWNNNTWSIPPAPVPPPLLAPPPGVPGVAGVAGVASVAGVVSRRPLSPHSPPRPVAPPAPAPPFPLTVQPASIPAVGSIFPREPPASPPHRILTPPPPTIPVYPLKPLPIPPVPIFPLDTPASPPGIPMYSHIQPAVMFGRDTPVSPPPPLLSTPPPPPTIPVYNRNLQDMPAADVDHRGILPPPPPPPVLPLLGNIEDVDHRLLPTLPPPPAPPGARHSQGQDVDHRNLISLTHQPRPAPPAPPAPALDQDYRVTPIVPPSDIVESVDMDLSEDEDQQGMYPNEHRRNSFNNNKVLVGGDNGKTNRDNRPIRESDPRTPHSAPILPPMTNPFDNMPMGLKNLNMPYKKPFEKEENSNDSAYEEDLRQRGLDHIIEQRNRSPEYEVPENEWQNQRNFHNQRFPRNWGPRTNFRPPFGPQMWPRNGPRPPNRWMGPRQRFW